MFSMYVSYVYNILYIHRKHQDSKTIILWSRDHKLPLRHGHSHSLLLSKQYMCVSLGRDVVQFALILNQVFLLDQVLSICADV